MFYLFNHHRSPSVAFQDLIKFNKVHIEGKIFLKSLEFNPNVFFLNIKIDHIGIN